MKCAGAGSVAGLARLLGAFVAVNRDGHVFSVQDNPSGRYFPAIGQDIQGFALIAPEWNNSPAGHPQKPAQRQIRLADSHREFYFNAIHRRHQVNPQIASERQQSAGLWLARR